MDKNAKVIVYIFDLTEPYPIEDQIKLYEQTKALGKPIIIYLSKADIIAPEVFAASSIKGITDSEELKKEIRSLIK